MSARTGRGMLMASAIAGVLGRAGREIKACVALGALVAVLAGAVVSSPVAGQEAAGGDVEVRIVARKLESGRIEFGLQQRSSDDTWGDRQLPRVRFFPTTAGVGRWLASSALDLPAGEVRIVARKLDSGRIEFGLQQRSPDDTWGDRQLPRVRFFPTTAGVGRWLASSPLILRTSRPADRDAAVTDDDQTTSRPADRDPAVTDDDQTTSRPADRDPAVTDDDQTASRPADRDPAVTDDDRYAQFEGDTVEVASPHDWWLRPRGDLLVHVHLCVEQGNEHLAKRELIDAHVRSLNEIEAPFYSWQSSGLLNVSFTAGTITIANDVASTWGPGYLPASCMRSLSVEAHIGHAVILVGNPEEITCGGWGYLGGSIGATYIEGAAAQTVASIKRQLDQLIFTIRHELDHTIGVHHVYAPSRSDTRFNFAVSLEEWETLRGGDGNARLRGAGQLVGTFSGFPAALQQHTGIPQMFPCDFLEQQGWPVGPNKPACFRRPPNSAQDLRVDWRADGRPRVTWQPPSHSVYSSEPVTGYTILVSTVTFDSRGNPRYSAVLEYGERGEIVDWDDSVIFDLDLPADARSFVLPRSPIGEHEYQVGDTFAVTVIPQSAVGLGEFEDVYASVGFPQSEISINENFTGCIANCGPREFVLSWPSSDLVDRWLFVREYWVRSTPDGPIYYQRRNFQATAGSSNSQVIHESIAFIGGQSYNATVFGCLKDYSRRYSDLIDGRCFPYATGTFTLGTREPSVHDVSERQLTISLGEDAGEHEFMCQPDTPCRSVFVTLNSFPSGPETPGPHEFVCYVSDGSPNSTIVAGTATYANLGDLPWTAEVCAVNLVPGGSVYVELDSVRSNTVTL